MNIIIHIGLTKTGTSSIQNFLFHNEKLLYEKGYLYLHDEGRVETRGLAAYALDLNRSDDYLRRSNIDNVTKRAAFKAKYISELTEKLNNLPSHIHTIIISSEHLSARLQSREEIERIKKAFSIISSNFKIVCYIRNQVDKLYSQYSTEIKSGSTRSFDNFTEKFIQRLDNNLDLMLTMWEDVFGKGHIQVKIFKKSEFYNEDLLVDFARVINPSLASCLYFDLERSNESLSAKGIMIFRRINLLFSKLSRRMLVRKINLSILKMLVPYLHGEGLKITDQQRNKIEDKFKSSNEKVRQRYFPNKDSLFKG